MTIVRAVCAIGLVLAATAASAKIRTQSDSDKLQAACYDDVQSLCADAIPDEDKVTVCISVSGPVSAPAA